MKPIAQICLTAALAMILLRATAEPLLVDSFESGDMSATNSDGFKWSSNNRTSVVTESKVVWNNGVKSVAIPSGRNWTPYTGQHSLRFLYSASEPMTEQRFMLGKAYPDIWFRFWLRVPLNYQHDGRNRKLFALWMDGYSGKGNGPTVIWEFWPDGGSASKLAFHYGPGGYENTGGHMQHQRFIDYPADRGRWMQLVLRVKASSSKDAKDGIIETWRRWAGETEFTKFHEMINADMAFPQGGPQGWHAGYVMGWANDAYKEPTEWLLDEFTVSKESLLSASSRGERPKPPIGLTRIE